MTVLVTGGLGVIGSWAVRALVEQGERPVVLDTRNDTRLVHDLLKQFEVEDGDILDPAVLYRVGYRYGVDRICHLAAALPPAVQANPSLGFRINCQGTVAVLDLARALGVQRFVYTSSKAVYGPPAGPYGHPEYQPIPEDHPYNPTDGYGATKLGGELMVRQYQASFGLDTVVLRLASTYGPGKTERHGDVGTVSRMIESIRTGEPVVLAHGGDERSDYVYNRDVGRAVALAAFAAQPRSRIYNVGTGVGLSLREVRAIIQSIAPTAPIEVGDGVGYAPGREPTGSIPLTARAAEELGFVATYDFAAGVRDYLRVMDTQETATCPGETGA